MLNLRPQPPQPAASMLKPSCGASTSGSSAATTTATASTSSGRGWRRRLPQRPRCFPLAAFDPRQRGTTGGGPPQQQLSRDRAGQRGGYDYPPPPGAPYSSNAGPQGPAQQQQQQQQQPQPPPPPPPDGGPDGGANGGFGGLSGYTKALIAAAFVTGLGAGVYFDAEINLSPNQVASTEIIDRRTPNSEVCMAYGYSAMVFDQRVFVTYNPFNLYVTQPEVKPGCVLRRSNFNVLEKDALVSGKQVEACKRRMNTFGFVGDLADTPEVSCLYHSEEAENQYLLNPDKALGSSETSAAKAAAAAAAAATGGAAAAAGGGP